MNTIQQALYFGNVALDRERERKMVFYGRVSTQHEAQIDALGNQMQWYEDQMKYHPNWDLVGRYIDEGITGTLAKKRPSFMRMIQEAKQGQFDLIVTREVCRFARNTVDTLMLTRELKSYGVEVYFVSDNIWTMDGDGELRLSIMATMAQEESRKISERVLAGQAVSREKGVLYGNGNILGYKRAGKSYQIEPEEAETVRMIYHLYEQGNGMMLICNELTRLGRKNSKGDVKWTCPTISRTLRNATYMGCICYNKSKTTNYLDKKRIKNLDDNSVVTMKGDFEPIVSEQLWHECERIRNGKILQYHSSKGEPRKAGFNGTKHLWTDKLRCRCGSGYSRYTWRVLKDQTPVYGYQCLYRTSNPAKSYVERHGLKGVKTCDAISICEWKLEMMAKKIFDQIWGEQKSTVLKVCQMIESCTKQVEKRNSDCANAKEGKIKKLRQRKLRYSRMYADGDLERTEYKALCQQTDEEIGKLERTSAQIMPPAASQEDQIGTIEKALEKLIDISGSKISDELIDEFVEVATPVGNHHFRWKMNFGQKKNHLERTDMMAIQEAPVLHFIIDFEMALKYRQANHLPAQFRRRDWNDLTVDVYL